ncbi:MAG: hypothetical protein IT449_08745 [Phycisphaerales bacterium]|nr:hypothetical protein [Phycisphaerales bacterium]
MHTCLWMAMVFAMPVDEGAIPRPEHPRPDLQREAWLNLNGPWDFAETDDSADESFLTREEWPDKIIVPFCRESKLSGLQRKGFVKHVWYRRTLAIPKEWTGKRVLLHIGACDWRTTAWLDGVLLGEHTGGNVPITWELKDVQPGATHTLVIRAFDDTRSGLQQLGKQSDREDSYGIFYTRTTGIWQTVWLEAVGTSFIRDFSVAGDPAAGVVTCTTNVDGPLTGLDLRIDVFAGTEKVGSSTRAVRSLATVQPIELTTKHAWSPDDPFLYTAKLSLLAKDSVRDEVATYFGLRSIDIRGRQFLINGKPVYQRLVLDQGFYPDGVWTAPTDDALRRDIELSKAAGFNGARLHQKIFEPRFHYWADKLGYLTWGETPSFGANYEKAEVALPVVHEAVEFIRRDRNHPSIIGWCPFNETPPQAGPLQNVVYEMVKTLDPTRPVIETSGWVKSHPDPDVDCRHDYTQDGAALGANWASIGDAAQYPPQYGIADIDRPFFLSEFGGIGWIPEGKQGWGYGQSPKTLDEWYARYDGQLKAVTENRFMFGYCYTQLTDVEQECNGIYYYDRSPKFDMARVRSSSARPAAYESSPPRFEAPARVQWRTLVRAAVDPGEPTDWRYTTETPKTEASSSTAPDWSQADFDDSAWTAGRGGFGSKAGWESRIRTAWATPDIRLRAVFDFDRPTFGRAVVMMHYDNATEVFVNGVELLGLTGWNDTYAAFDVTEKLRAALRSGRNVIAVHTHQDTGGQFIDLALLTSGALLEP